jgi:hypothetical protein
VIISLPAGSYELIKTSGYCLQERIILPADFVITPIETKNSPSPHDGGLHLRIFEQPGE